MSIYADYPPIPSFIKNDESSVIYKIKMTEIEQILNDATEHK